MLVVEVTDPDQMDAALALRFAVFVDEQGVDPDAEHDGLDDDPSTVHVVALTDEGGPVVGVGRLLAPAEDGRPHIGRVAVAREARRTGVGKAVMDALERVALERYGRGGEVTVALSAQVQAIPFYEEIGYVVTGERYLDEGIWHRDATKSLRSRP